MRVLSAGVVGCLALATLLLGTSHPANAQTVLNLSANGTDNVDPDRIIAVLQTQFTSTDAAKAQAEVNNAMSKALGAAKSVAGASVTTSDYSVYQSTPPDGSQKPVYQASQNLQLSMDAPGAAPPAAFTALVGQLQQKGLLLSSLSGELSEKAQASAQQNAIDDAIRQIQAQAKAVAVLLGEQTGKIQTLNVNVNMPGPVMRVAPMMMAAALPPQSAPAKVTVQASVSATLTLAPLP